MPEYRYRAVNESGVAVTGTMEEESALRVSSILREQGLQVSSIERITPAPALPRIKQRISWEDIHLFNEQLRIITKSGLPLAHALKAIALEMRNPNMRAMLEDIQQSLESGKTVSEAFGRHANSLPPVYLNAIEAGDRTGNLPGVIVQLSNYSAQMMRIKSSLLGAMAYPAVVLFVAVVVIWYMLGYIVPQFAAVFADFGAQLPALTRAVIQLSRSLTGNPLTVPVALLLAAGMILGGKLITRQVPALAFLRDQLKLRLFLIRRINFPSAMARFSRTSSLLLRGGVPADECLALAGAASGNLVLGRAADRASELVRQGRPLSGALDDTNFFPPVFCWLVSLAEERGEIPATLEELAESYETSTEQQGKFIVALVGPVCLVLLALAVISIILSLYLPIFSLSDVLSGS
ncbi:MAG: fimbrial assembly protein PilC [Candidatus Hydrogenedentota bacterium]